MSDSTTPRFDTIAVHGGAAPDPTTGSRAVPIYQTVAYNFKDTDHAADLFGLRAFGNIYSRIMNPTNDVLEQRVAALEGGSAALAVSSGHAAEVLALLNVAGTGDNIVSSTSLYGGTWNIFLHTFRRLGIEVRFVETTDNDGFAAASDDTTTRVVRRDHRQPAPRRARHRRAGIGWPRDRHPALRRQHLRHPLPLRARSSTVRPSSSNRSPSGSAVTARRSAASWSTAATSTGATGRFPFFTEPDESYHGLKFWDVFGDFPGLGNVAFAIRARVNLLRDLGSALSPFNAQQFLLGVETLSLRVQRHSDNALAVARYLENHPKVAWVAYPGLESHPTHENAKKYLENGFGGVVVFGVKGGLAAGKTLIEGVELFSHLANVGDAKSLIIHPASTTHSQLSAEELVKAGIGEDFIRLSVGIESIEDILADLEQALEKV